MNAIDCIPAYARDKLDFTPRLVCRRVRRLQEREQERQNRAYGVSPHASRRVRDGTLFVLTIEQRRDVLPRENHGRTLDAHLRRDGAHPHEETKAGQRHAWRFRCLVARDNLHRLRASVRPIVFQQLHLSRIPLHTLKWDFFVCPQIIRGKYKNQ